MEGYQTLRQSVVTSRFHVSSRSAQIHLFAHLTTTKLVSPQSMYDLLRSFTTVLDEFGVSHGRAKQAARCAAEGLMMASQFLRRNLYRNLLVYSRVLRSRRTLAQTFLS
jgi:hypothetical protein